MKAIAKHLPWASVIGIAFVSAEQVQRPDHSLPDTALQAWLWVFCIVGWVSMIRFWKDPSEIAKKVALFTFPVGVLLYWLSDAKQDEAMGFGLIFFGIVPFWIMIAIMAGGSEPRVDGRDAGPW